MSVRDVSEGQLRWLIEPIFVYQDVKNMRKVDHPHQLVLKGFVLVGPKAFGCEFNVHRIISVKGIGIALTAELDAYSCLVNTQCHT